MASLVADITPLVAATDIQDDARTIKESVPSSEPHPASPSIQHIDAASLDTNLTARVAYLKSFMGWSDADAAILKKFSKLVGPMVEEMVDMMYAKLFEFDVTKGVFLARNTGFSGDIASDLDTLTLDSSQIKYRKVFMKVWANRVLTGDYSNDKIWKYMDKVGIMHTGSNPFRRQAAPLHVDYVHIAVLLGWVQNLLTRVILTESFTPSTSAVAPSPATGCPFHDPSSPSESTTIPHDHPAINTNTVDNTISTPETVPEEEESASYAAPPRSIEPPPTMEERIQCLEAIGKVIWMQNDLISRHYVRDVQEFKEAGFGGVGK